MFQRSYHSRPCASVPSRDMRCHRSLASATSAGTTGASRDWAVIGLIAEMTLTPLIRKTWPRCSLHHARHW